MGRRLSGAPEGEQLDLSIPALEDVDPPVVDRIGGLHEIETTLRLTGQPDHIRIGIEERRSVCRIDHQVSSDDEHEPNLTRSSGPFPLFDFRSHETSSAAVTGRRVSPLLPRPSGGC